MAAFTVVKLIFVLENRNLISETGLQGYTKSINNGVWCFISRYILFPMILKIMYSIVNIALFMKQRIQESERDRCQIMREREKDGKRPDNRKIERKTE